MISASILIEQIIHTTLLEWIAVIAGILFSILASYEKNSCWFFGFISSVIYIYICSIHHLYQDAGISIYYAIMAFVGFAIWNGWIKKKENIFHIEWSNFSNHILNLLFAISYTIGTGYLFARYTNASFPYIDAFTTSFAIVATWLQTRKKIDSWIYFLILNIVSIWLYYQKELVLTSFLYIFYSIISIIGLFTWNKKTTPRLLQ